MCADFAIGEPRFGQLPALGLIIVSQSGQGNRDMAKYFHLGPSDIDQPLSHFSSESELFEQTYPDLSVDSVRIVKGAEFSIAPGLRGNNPTDAEDLSVVAFSQFPISNL